MPRDYWKKAEVIEREFEKKLIAQDSETMALLTQKYTELIAPLEKQIQELVNVKIKTPDQIRRLEVYQQFLKDLETQMRKYNIYADGLITAKQGVYIQLGLESSQRVISLAGVSFQKLNPGALKWMMGTSINGGRLFELLEKSYPESVGRITNTLIESVAIGRNPRQTARLIQQDMAGNLSRALRISRTETIQAYRESSRVQMKESGLVEEWEWLSEDDACDFCLVNNGKRFPVEEPFETHPNCRCVNLPIVSI